MLAFTILNYISLHYSKQRIHSRYSPELLHAEDLNPFLRHPTLLIVEGEERLVLFLLHFIFIASHVIFMVFHVIFIAFHVIFIASHVIFIALHVIFIALHVIFIAFHVIFIGGVILKAGTKNHHSEYECLF